MSFLKGKTAIITGAGFAALADGRCGSIGYGIATAYAKEGANLVITGRNVSKLEKAKEQLEKLQALEKRLPQKLQQDVVMAELHSVAKGSGVRLKALRQNGKGSFKKQSIVLYLEAEGNYEKLVKFLQAVEAEGSFKNLQEFTAKGDEKNGSLEISGVVSAYIN